jgi:hypothetical protein
MEEMSDVAEEVPRYDGFDIQTRDPAIQEGGASAKPLTAPISTVT